MENVGKTDKENSLRKIHRKFFPFTDGVSESSFPFAALLTGVLLTIGAAVFLFLVLTLKKKREIPQPHENGIKEKQIGKQTFLRPRNAFEILSSSFF